MTDRWSDDARQRWLNELRFEFSFRAIPCPIISGITDGRSPRQILEDLRAEDPDGHANLTEYIVLPEDEE